MLGYIFGHPEAAAYDYAERLVTGLAAQAAVGWITLVSISSPARARLLPQAKSVIARCRVCRIVWTRSGRYLDTSKPALVRYPLPKRRACRNVEGRLHPESRGCPRRLRLRPTGEGTRSNIALRRLDILIAGSGARCRCATAGQILIGSAQSGH